ncbi:hypothetical protein C8Q76DRAFT_611713, partial [Earliella scabrosa]
PCTVRRSVPGYTDQDCTANYLTAISRRAPLPVPITPRADMTAAYEDLNSALLAWGYQEDTAGYLVRVREEVHAARREARWERWVESQSQWLLEGDDLLDTIQSLLIGELFGDFSSQSAQFYWRALTATAFKIQYIMTTVYAFIDVYSEPGIETVL